MATLERISTPTLIDDATLEALQARLRGQLICPKNAAYDETRRIYNGMIDKYPSVIARCANVADVIYCVNFAREQQLSLSIRSGGHHGAGLSLCDDGIVIDLSQMKGIRVDPMAQTARVEGGCTWADVDHATHAFGLATPSGIHATTGVGGLTLGGGLGYLTRQHGLTIDNLLSVDMVLADGRFVTASADENEDLFWAVRGGGGNFGVVTSFVFKLHPVKMVYAGPMLWPLEQAAEVMRFWRDFILTAPEDINGWFAFLTVAPVAPFPEELHLKKMCGVMWHYSGPMDKAEEVFAPIRRFAQPALDWVGPLPYPAVQSMFVPLYPTGMQWYWKADFVNELNEAAIARHIEHGSQLPSIHSTMHLYPINGAAHRIGKNDTAFSYRESNWAEVIVGVDPDPANADKISAWARVYWEALHPYSAGGAYVNMMMEEGQERVQASYRDNYERLVSVKTKYDPTNLFHMNQNIKPTV